MSPRPLRIVLGCSVAAWCACRPEPPPPPPPMTGPPPAAAQPPAPPPSADVPTLQVGRVGPTDIKIDGTMNEPAWATCGTTGALVSPMDGRPVPSSRVPAEFRVCASPTHLLVGAVVKDPEAASPFKRDDVDPHLWERSSAVELMIQPGNPGDNKVYYEVQVDVVGAVWDTWFDDYNRPRGQAPDGTPTYGHQEWNSHVERAITTDAGRTSYTVEMAIPWTSLSSERTPVPPRPGDAWRANFYSFRDGQRDSLAWSPLLGRGNFHFAARFGRLQF